MPLMNATDNNAKLQRPSFVKAFEDNNTITRSKREHNYYHHQQSNSKKNSYEYDQNMMEDSKEVPGGGYQFSKSFHDLSFANNMYQPHVFRANLEENRSGTSVDNNLDLILPPKDYLGYRANERSDGYRTLGAPKSRRTPDGNKSFSYHQKGGDVMHKKRSQSFLVHSGHANISSDEKYANHSNVIQNEVDVQHVRARQKPNSGRRSRKLYGEDTKYADDFHKNKRHTYHFPDVDVDNQFNHCEDLTFTKHLSRENISNGNLNKSSAENLLHDNGGHLLDNQYYNYSKQDRIKSSRTDRTNDFAQSSYLDDIRTSHQRSSSSPPSTDVYGMPIRNGKTEGKHRQNYGLNRNTKKTERNGLYNDNQVHYSTIDHTKSSKAGEKNSFFASTGKTNMCKDNYVNNNSIINTGNQNIVNNSPNVANECSFLHIEREIPMQSASLEAQKFKTIIFLSGQ